MPAPALPPAAPSDAQAETGLTAAEAAQRREKYGYNEVAEEKERPLLKLLAKFWSLSAWMLELIMLLSACLKRYPDLAVVGVLLVLNAVVGFAQEHRAAGVVAVLRKRLQVNARVRRGGAWQLLPARELVPGDIIRVRPGDIAPTDAKILSGELSADLSALTGESKDADLSPGGLLPSGAIVRRGEGTGVVMLTGAKAAWGRTSELVRTAQPKLHIEAVIAKIVRWLFAIVGLILALVVALSLARRAPLAEMLPLVLVLLMSAVPVALPVMFTVSMAVGAKELAKRGVLITRLSAVEDAATMDVLCVDKTGTITMNQLAVSSVIPLGQSSEAELLLAGASASQEADQDPIDLAFLRAARERHAFEGLPAVKGISFKPFDAATRCTEAVIEQGGQRWRLMKGSVQSVADACGLAAPARSALEACASASASKGCRSLAVARGPEGGALALLGLVALYDPPREDAKALISALRKLGIAVKMLTGDGLEVAQQSAKEVGLGKIRRMSELKASGAATDLLADADGLAEVYPEDKDAVVKHLQAASHVTGMTGDGVNDAPALRQAEVGIAVSSATDVAKGAASVVLTEAGLANIVALVEQGRTIYQRLLTYIINKVSRATMKAAFVAIAYIVTGRFVISALAMLLLTFMTDFAKITLALDNVRPSKKPESWAIGGYISVSVAVGLAMVLEALLLLAACWQRFGLAASSGALHSFTFLMLLYLAILSLLSARERSWFWASAPSKALIAALAAEALVGTGLTYAGLPGLAPLPWQQVFLLFAAALALCLVVNDSLKVALIRWRKLEPAAP